MTNSRHISVPLVVLLVSLILYPTFARSKHPPKDLNQTPRKGLSETAPQDPKQKDPPPQQKDPMQFDPEQKDPTGQDPRQIDPVQFDLEQMDPTGQDPKQKDPMHFDPQQMDPTGHDPKQKIPTRRALKQKDPMQFDPGQKDPTGQDLRQIDPVQFDLEQMDPTGQDPKQKDPMHFDPQQMDPTGHDPLQKDPTRRALEQTPTPQDPNQSSPPIPKNHLPQNPKQSPPPIPDHHLPQNPKINPPKDSVPPPPQEETQIPTQFHNRFKGHFSAVYAFGDSYTDTGNAQSMGSLTKSFADSASSPYGSHRLSDGRLVIDYITDSLGLPVLPPYQSTTANFTYGVNFAIAGATAIANDLLSKLARFFLLKGNPVSVMTQLDWYKKFQKDKLCKGMDQKACAEKLKTALFWVGEIGINDYSRALGSKIPLPSIAKSSATYTIELVRTLIQNGAKHIVVQGLPPVGCLPLDVSFTPLNTRDKSGCSPIVNGAVSIHNQILQAKLESFRKSSPDVTIIYADAWKAYFTIANDPEKYKILETQKTCCGSTKKPGDMNFNIQSLCGSSGTSVCVDPSQYISWDGIHPTESMNSHMTDQYINNGCCNPPFEELMKNQKSPL